MNSPIWIALFGLLAAFWVVAGLNAIVGARRIPRLDEVAPLGDAECPSVSILVAARDEEAMLPQALATLVAQDYPRCEVIAVDDRSRDATPRILDEFARQHSNLKVVHIRELPKGWLGKPHALTQAYKQSSGEWLVFTDADVRFAPDLVRRAVSLARARSWDHLPGILMFENEDFWERIALTYWVLAFLLGQQPWQTWNPRSSRYLGVGAFQLVRRAVYEAIGTHRRLAMEVIEDMKLGKLVKQGGFRSGVFVGEERLKLRYEPGLGNLIRAFTKNFFAAVGFSVTMAAIALVFTLALSVLPFVALGFTSGWTLALCGAAVAVAAGLHARISHEVGLSPLYGLTHPIGALLVCYMLVRSTVVTLWQGGVRWRDTFYPLDELRKGRV